MKTKYIIFLIVLVIIMCGCAAWQLVKVERKWKYSNLEANIPGGWMKFNSPTDILFLTRDGELLQTIRIYRYQTEKNKELPISKKKFSNNMLTQEIAELIINEIGLRKGTQNLKLLEDTPTKVGGQEGFKLEYTFNTADSLQIKSIIYGFKDNKFIYLIQYQAAQQYYFDKDIVTFQKFINDFRVLK